MPNLTLPSRERRRPRIGSSGIEIVMCGLTPNQAMRSRQIFWNKPPALNRTGVRCFRRACSTIIAAVIGRPDVEISLRDRPAGASGIIYL